MFTEADDPDILDADITPAQLDLADDGDPELAEAEAHDVDLAHALPRPQRRHHHALGCRDLLVPREHHCGRSAMQWVRKRIDTERERERGRERWVGACQREANARGQAGTRAVSGDDGRRSVA